MSKKGVRQRTKAITARRTAKPFGGNLGTKVARVVRRSTAKAVGKSSPKAAVTLRRPGLSKKQVKGRATIITKRRAAKGGSPKPTSGKRTTTRTSSTAKVKAARKAGVVGQQTRALHTPAYRAPKRSGVGLTGARRTGSNPRTRSSMRGNSTTRKAKGTPRAVKSGASAVAKFGGAYSGRSKNEQFEDFAKSASTPRLNVFSKRK